MATFNVGKGKDDIQEAVLLPEDWYIAEISREPYKDKNNAWKTAGEKLSLEEAKRVNEKAGENIVIPLRLKSDIPEADGRMMTKWIPIANRFDEGRYDNRGQHIPDAKAEVAHKWCEAFGGGADGADISFKEGQKAWVYIIVSKDQDGETDVNSISMNVHPRALGGEPTAGGESVDDLL